MCGSAGIGRRVDLWAGSLKEKDLRSNGVEAGGKIKSRDGGNLHRHNCMLDGPESVMTLDVRAGYAGPENALFYDLDSKAALCQWSG